MAKESNNTAAKKAVTKVAAKKVVVKKVAAKKAAVKKVAAVTVAAPVKEAAPVKVAAPTKAVAPVKKVATPAKEPVAAKKAAPAKKVAVKKAPVKKTPAKKAASKLTTIVAKIDVGFGNSVSLRGEGAGLSWDKGTVMGSAGSDEWVWSSDAVKGTLEFKVLMNDDVWAEGANLVIKAGERIVVEPTF